MSARSTVFGGVALLCLVLTGSGCGRSIRAVRHFSKAKAAMAAGNYSRAESEFKLALEYDPDDVEVMGRLGQLYVDEGRVLPAYLLLKRSVGDDPGEPRWELPYGLVCLTLRRMADANAAARSVLAKEPTNMTALVLLADTCEDFVARTRAAEFIHGLARGRPDCAGFHAALGELDLADEDWGPAKAEIDDALRLEPDSGLIHGELGRYYLARRDVRDAEAALAAAARLSPLRSAERLNYVSLLEREGRLGDARREIDAITAGAPDFIPGLIAAMRLAAHEKRTEDCLALVARILAKDPVNYEALAARADIELQRQQVDGAIADLQLAANFYRNSPPIKYQLAQAYLRKDDVGAAENALNEALLLDPEYDDATLLLSEIDLRNGDPASAASKLLALLKRRPGLAEAAFLLAQAYRAEGSTDQALSIFQQFETQSPNLPTGPYLVGMALLEEGRRDEARDAFLRSVKDEEDYWPAQEMLVHLAVANGRMAAADARVSRLMSRYPKASDPYLFRAVVRSARGERAAAEADLRHALALDPGSQYAHDALARLLLADHRADEAIAQLSAFAKRSGSLAALMQVGMLQDQTKQYALARSTYEAVLAKDGNFAPALNNLAALYCDRFGDLDQALALARKAQTLAPTDPLIEDTLGWILFRRGRYAEALPLLDDAASRLPGYAGVLYHAGMEHYALGQEARAAEEFQDVLDAPGNAQYAPDVRERLEILKLDPAKAGPGEIADLRLRIQKTPHNPIAYSRLAAIELARGDATAAAADYERALGFAPDSIPFRIALMQIYTGPVPRPRRARVLAKEAHELAPGDAAVAIALGRMLYRNRDYAWSVDLLREGSQNGPADATVMLELAHACYAAGRIPEAASTLSQAFALDPAAKTGSELRWQRLVAATEEPALAVGAVPAARQQLASSPHDIAGLMVDALAEEQAGKFGAARDAYLSLLQTDGEFAPAARRLAILYAERFGQDRLAEQYAIQARQALPNDPALAFELGAISYRKEAYDDALRFLNQRLELAPPDGPTLFYLGMANYRTGDASEARTLLARAMQLQLSVAQKKEAGRVLAELGRGGGVADSK